MTRGKYAERARSVRAARGEAVQAEKERRAAVAEVRRRDALVKENERLRAALEEALAGTSPKLRELEERLENALQAAEILDHNFATLALVAKQRAVRIHEAILGLDLDLKQRAVVLEVVMTALNDWKVGLPVLARLVNEPRPTRLRVNRAYRRHRKRLGQPHRSFRRPDADGVEDAVELVDDAEHDSRHTS